MSTLRDPPGWTVPWPSTALGFLLLAVPPFVMFGYGVWGTLLQDGLVFMSPVLLAGGLAVAWGIRYEWWELRRHIHEGVVDVGAAHWNLLAVISGTLLTFAAVTELGVSPIVAASLVGVIAAIAVQRVAVPVYCGAFVGMTSPALFGSYWFAGLAALLSGLLFTIAHPLFHGVGGKLGTTAFVGVTMVLWATAESFQSGPLPGQLAILQAVGLAALGAVITFAIHTRTVASTVLASGLVGLGGGLGVPLVLEGPVGLQAAAIYSASFAGMTDPRRISKGWWIGVTGIGVGIVVVYTSPFLGGSGGKLGTIAFGSCLGVHGVLRKLHLLRLGRAGYEAPEQETT